MIISLTTDFGLDDPFVGTMKGVILGRAPEVSIVDVVHNLAPGDILAGMLALESAHPWFPPGAVHVGVVDPGVGSERKIIAVRAKGMTFLAPDNGLLTFLPAGGIESIHSVENRAYFLEPVSPTFHGRDIFAPVAAALALDLKPSDLGPPLGDFIRLDLPAPQRMAGGFRGTILAFDRFGNAITNLVKEHLPSGEAVAMVADRRVPFGETYSSVNPGEPLAYLGSSGRIEVGVRDDDARRKLSLRAGVAVELVKKPLR